MHVVVEIIRSPPDAAGLSSAARGSMEPICTLSRPCALTVFQCTMPSTVSLNVLCGCHAGIQKDKYLEPMLQPTDEAEMAERLKHRLTGQAPPAFTSLVGRSTYQKGMRDIHDMLQLPTFVTQIGYGVLEIGVLALYPELRDFFSRIHRDGAAPSGCNADSTS